MNRSDFIVKEIALAVSEVFLIDVELLIFPTRKREVADARHCMRYLIKQYIPTAPLTWIGKKTGNAHHSTILHSIDTWGDLLITDKTLKEQTFKVRELVSQRIKVNVGGLLSEISTDKYLMPLKKLRTAPSSVKIEIRNDLRK